MTVLETFDAFFERATGHAPYEYQRRFAEASEPPSVLAVPTGAGKTQALLCSWLYYRRVRGLGPRRLVYALPMRTLVEQTYDVALQLRSALGLTDAELPVHKLMGGEEHTDWREHPELDQILIGTVDMLLSRALNRGYGESRFAWPASFGLLNADCRWIFDEVQLMGPARTTSAQLAGLRERLGTALPCQTVWASATVDAGRLETIDHPALGRQMTLADADRADALAKRLGATKRLDRLDLAGVPPARLARVVVDGVLERHTRGSRTLVVLNTVDLAQSVHDALLRSAAHVGDAPSLVLLHSRFRPPDRAARMTEALAAPERGGSGTIVVATQVVEAGVDLSSRLLVTETAPFSSIVQRVGRCNRAGEYPEGASVLWLDRGELEGPTASRVAAPYDPDDLAATRVALSGRLGTSLSPDALGEMRVPERSEDTAVLRRRDLLDLFDTAPDLSGLDVDVSRFIRAGDDRTASGFFRAVSDDAEAAKQPAPGRDELVNVPLGSFGRHRTWTFDHVEGSWRRPERGGIRPGSLVLLAVADGGYDPARGWTGRPTDRPEPIEPPIRRDPEAIGDDPGTTQRSWMTLGDHLARAMASARSLVDHLALQNGGVEAGTAVVTAAALHDVGKAHSVFQHTLIEGADAAERESRRREIWAKSDHGRGSHGRPHFRHELASALVLRGASADPSLAVSDLVLYLVAAHHGRVRLSIRPAPEEPPPTELPSGARFALGIYDGDELPPVDTPLGLVGPATLDLSCMALGGAERSWSQMACDLRDDPRLGPFRLAFLEALVRVADWRASSE